MNNHDEREVVDATDGVPALLTFNDPIDERHAKGIIKHLFGGLEVDSVFN